MPPRQMPWDAWAAWPPERLRHVMSARPDVEEYHAEQHQGQVDNLGLEVFLVESHRAEEETNHHAATAYHRHDAYHGPGYSQGIEVDKVCCA